MKIVGYAIVALALLAQGAGAQQESREEHAACYINSKAVRRGDTVWTDAAGTRILAVRRADTVAVTVTTPTSPAQRLEFVIDSSWTKVRCIAYLDSSGTRHPWATNPDPVLERSYGLLLLAWFPKP